MSKFFKALEQAEKDRRSREQEPEPVLLSEEEAFAPEEPAPVPRPADEERPSRRVEPGPAPSLPATPGNTSMDAHLVSLLAPATAHAEQYRTLRNTIEAKATPGRGYVVAISSPGKGDGKTTTAINLAGALTQSESTRVLLLDADLRAPSLAHKIGLGASRGLAEAIGDPSFDFSRVTRASNRPNLGVLPAGRPTRTPYETLQSHDFADFMERARGAYDFIVVDTPPLIPMPDCRLIGRYVDGMVLVIAAHRTPRKLLEESLRELSAEKLLGFVFNRADEPFPGGGGYYAYYYGESDETSNGHRSAGAWLRRWFG